MSTTEWKLSTAEWKLSTIFFFNFPTFSKSQKICGSKMPEFAAKYWKSGISGKKSGKKSVTITGVKTPQINK